MGDKINLNETVVDDTLDMDNSGKTLVDDFAAFTGDVRSDPEVVETNGLANAADDETKDQMFEKHNGAGNADTGLTDMATTRIKTEMSKGQAKAASLASTAVSKASSRVSTAMKGGDSGSFLKGLGKGKRKSAKGSLEEQQPTEECDDDIHPARFFKCAEVDELRRKLRELHPDGEDKDPSHLFKRFDHDSTGRLTVEQFFDAVRIGGHIKKSLMSDDELDQVFMALNKDIEFGEVSIDHLVEFAWGVRRQAWAHSQEGEKLPPLTPDEVEKLRVKLHDIQPNLPCGENPEKMFDNYINKRFTLECDNFKLAVREMGHINHWRMTDSDLDAIFWSLVKSPHDDEVKVAAVVNFAWSRENKPVSRRLSHDEVNVIREKLRNIHPIGGDTDPRRLFEKYDKDNTGHLSIEQFTDAIRRGGHLNKWQLTDIELEQVFLAMNQDPHGGAVDIDELVYFAWGMRGTQNKPLTPEQIDELREKLHDIHPSGGQKDPKALFDKYAAIHPGRLMFKHFVEAVRVGGHINHWKMPDSDLEQVFEYLGGNSALATSTVDIAAVVEFGWGLGRKGKAAAKAAVTRQKPVAKAAAKPIEEEPPEDFVWTPVAFQAPPNRVMIRFIEARCVNRSWVCVDSFCKCEVVGKPECMVRTKVQRSKTIPMWNEEHELHDCMEGDALLFTLQERERLTKGIKGALMGMATLASKQFRPNGWKGELDIKYGELETCDAMLRVEVTPLEKYLRVAGRVPPGTRLSPRVDLVYNRLYADHKERKEKKSRQLRDNTEQLEAQIQEQLAACARYATEDEVEEICDRLYSEADKRRTRRDKAEADKAKHEDDLCQLSRNIEVDESGEPRYEALYEEWERKQARLEKARQEEIDRELQYLAINTVHQTQEADPGVFDRLFEDHIVRTQRKEALKEGIDNSFFELSECRWQGDPKEKDKVVDACCERLFHDATKFHDKLENMKQVRSYHRRLDQGERTLSMKKHATSSNNSFFRPENIKAAEKLGYARSNSLYDDACRRFYGKSVLRMRRERLVDDVSAGDVSHDRVDKATEQKYINNGLDKMYWPPQKGSSRPRPLTARKSRKGPRTALVQEAFHQLAAKSQQKLDHGDMLRLARCLGYEGDDRVWAKDFNSICIKRGWNVEDGITQGRLADLLTDESNDNMYKTNDAQLIAALKVNHNQRLSARQSLREVSIEKRRSVSALDRPRSAEARSTDVRSADLLSSEPRSAEPNDSRSQLSMPKSVDALPRDESSRRFKKVPEKDQADRRALVRQSFAEAGRQLASERRSTLAQASAAAEPGGRSPGKAAAASRR